MSKEESTPYRFKGDNAKLVSSIKSLLALDSRGALVPNGVCGLARDLLESVIDRLEVDAQPVAFEISSYGGRVERIVVREDVATDIYDKRVAEGAEDVLIRPLFTRSDAGEVDRLNTVVEQQKNLIASLRAELRESHSITTIPDGYCVMPRRLTAENGAKALLLGEFNVRVTNDCPECVDLDEPDEYCEICDGEGEYCQRHMIPWDLIKFIYSKAVEGLAAKAEPADLESRPEERGCPEL